MSAAPDKQRQCALPVATNSDNQSTNNNVAMTTLDTPHISPEDHELTLNTSTLMGVSTRSATDPFDAPKAMGKWKRGKEHHKGLVAKKKSASKKEAAAKKKAVSKGKKKQRNESDEEESGPESMEDSEEVSSSESSSNGEAKDSADEHLVQALRARRSTRKTTMDPKHPDTEDLPIDPMVINPVVIGTLTQASRFSEHPPTQPSVLLVPRQPSPPLLFQPLISPARSSEHPLLSPLLLSFHVSHLPPSCHNHSFPLPSFPPNHLLP